MKDLDTIIAALECYNGPVMNQKCEACPYDYTYLIGDENGYPFFTCNKKKLEKDIYLALSKGE